MPDRFVVALTLALLLAACSDPADTGTAPAADAKADAPAAAEVAASDAKVGAKVNNWEQGYGASLTFHGGPANGHVVKLERDLAGIKGILSYGDTHLTPPALSFAMSDHVSHKAPDGKTYPVDVTLIFGYIAKSAAQPLQCGEPGTYPFSCNSPSLRVEFNGFSYRSVCPGLTGAIVVDDWSKAPGGRFAGTFAGRLQVYFQDSSLLDDCKAENTATTCKKTEWWVDVDGVYGFKLPQKNSDEAP